MNYYPPELTDWWMDDWISFVYGRHRSFKAHKVEIMHHTGAHGTRYEVNFANEGKLGTFVLHCLEVSAKYFKAPIFIFCHYAHR